jgi:hypothetical protein
MVRAAVALGVVLACTVAALGQAANTGTLSGNVTDSQKKVLVGAAVSLVNTATGEERTTQTNSKGEYLFGDVAVGNYNLTVSAEGFETYVVEAIQVDADTNVRTDAPMKPGSVSEQVTVESQGTTVDTRSATLGQMIDNRMVENLPVDGNNIVSLTALLPGVSNVNAPTTFTSDTGGPTYNVAGSRSNQNLFLFDGQLWNNLFYNTGLNFPPPPMLQETSILLNNYKAQYGRNVGSIMNVLSRSGSNQYHGTLWEFIQNRALNASDYISHLNPKLVQNQFGLTVSGPIKRDKLFFFAGVQDLRVAQSVFALAETLNPLERGWDVAPTGFTGSITAPTAVGGVPHMCQYPGFAGMQCANFAFDWPTTVPVSSSGTTIPNVPYYNQTLRNPLESSSTNSNFQTQMNAAWQQAGNTGQSPCVTAMNNLYTTLGNTGPYYYEYIPYQELPSICFNPVAVAFVDRYVPFPNTTGPGGNPYAQTTAAQPRNDWDGFLRGDLQLGRHTLDARFYITNVNDMTSNSAVGSSASLGGVASFEQDANSGGIWYGNIGDTMVVTPNILNVVRLGYKRYNYLIMPTDPTTLNQFGSNIVQPAAVSSLPQIEVENRFIVGSANSSWSWTVNEDEEADDNLTWQHGNHSMMFGGQYLRLQYLHRFEGTPLLKSGLTYTQSDASDYMAGLLVYTQVSNFTNLGALQNVFYFFAQDDWRATSRLTLNYGIRYELPYAWHSADGQGVAFHAGYQSQVIPQAPLGFGYEGDAYPGNASPRSRFNNLAPRFGFAYDMTGTGKATFRGGIGLFFDALNANVVGVGEPYHYNAVYNLSYGGISQPLLGQTQNFITPTYTTGNAIFGQPYSVNFADPNISTPYTIAVNLGFQFKVRATGTLETNYVGKFGRHQMVQYDLNPALTAFDTNYNSATFGQCIGPLSASQFAGSYCPTSSTAGTSVASYQGRVVYPGFAWGGIGVVDNNTVGSSNYHGLQIIYTQRAKKSLRLTASYTYSKSMDIQSNGQTNSAQIPQPTNLRSQYAVSDFDSTQQLNLGWVYHLPTTQKYNSVVRGMVNNWIFNGIYNAHTGQPYNLVISGDVAFTDERPQRPEYVPGVNPKLPGNRHRAQKVAEWFNTAAFETPVNPYLTAANNGKAVNAGTFGNVGRNALFGPCYIYTAFGLARIFNLPEYYFVHRSDTLEFKADAFNVFNTPNLANPQTNLSNGTSNISVSSFGSILSTVGTNGNVGTNGRRLQLSLVLRY